MFKKIRGLFQMTFQLIQVQANTLIYMQLNRVGIILHELSVVTIRKDVHDEQESVVAVSTEAKRGYFGRTPGSVLAARPFEEWCDC